jgi:hypothetical protein
LSALSFRRLALIAAPLIAAVLIVAGVFLDPDIDASGRELAQEYADNPGVTQLSAMSFHFAFIMWAPIVFALVGLVRGRGAWLANVAAVLAVLGATTLPGFLIVDFYDIAIAGELGLEAYDQVEDRIEELPGATVIFVTGLLGHLLCLPVALFAAWRARLMPLWTPVVVTAGLLAAQVVQTFGSGLVLAAVAMVGLAYALWRMDWQPREEPAGAAVLPPA